MKRNKRKHQPIGMLGRSSGNHDWLLANASACISCGFRHATQAIAFEWKPGLTLTETDRPKPPSYWALHVLLETQHQMCVHYSVMCLPLVQWYYSIACTVLVNCSNVWLKRTDTKTTSSVSVIIRQDN